MEPAKFDPYYIAKVLSDLISRQRGYECTLTVIPKEESASSEQDTGG